MPINTSKSSEVLAQIIYASQKAQRESSAVSLPRFTDELNDSELRHDKEVVIRNLRALGEHMEDTVRNHVIEKFLSKEVSLEDAIHAIHIAASAGWIPYEGEDRSAQVYEHTFRDSGVRFGDVVPVKSKDVEELFPVYVDALQRLLNNCKSGDFENVMSWAYISFVAIHPYPDANGRTGRAIVRFISEYFVKRFGYEGIKSFPNHKEQELRDKATDFMNRAMFELGFFPQFNDKNHQESSIDIYNTYLIYGKVDQYFSKLKKSMKTHFASIKSSEQLRKFGCVKEATAFLDNVELLKPNETRPLIALDAAERFSQLLVENHVSINELLQRELNKPRPQTDEEQYSTSNLVLSCFVAEFDAALTHVNPRKKLEIDALIMKYLQTYAHLLREVDKRLIADLIKEKVSM